MVKEFDKNDEQILVVTREGLFDGEKLEFQGYRTAIVGDVLLSAMSGYEVKRRGDMEDNPLYKQLITYAVIQDKWSGDLLYYKRLSKGGEKRLNGSLSIGVGGHTNEIDGLEGVKALLEENAMRELHEELYIEQDITPQLIGFVNNDSDEVGEVHIGIVYRVLVDDKDNISCRETDVLDIGWKSIDDLQEEENLEAWSKLVLEGM